MTSVSPVCPVIVAHLDRMPLLDNLVMWVNLDQSERQVCLDATDRLAVLDWMDYLVWPVPREILDHKGNLDIQEKRAIVAATVCPVRPDNLE